MMERMLDLLGAGGVHRVADLARELDTTPALVEAMLGDLERMGYLRQVCVEGQMSKGCGGACAGCPLAGACAATSGGQVWALTEKALRDRR